MVAQATALNQLADYLIERQFVSTTSGPIEVDARLAAICLSPNLVTFGEIAKFFLVNDSPTWIPFSFSRDVFQPELLPTEVENALAWLADLRDGVIFEAWQGRREDDSFKKWLGDLGESLVLAGERAILREVLHVSKISDSYGFDILSKGEAETARLEVKAVVESSADHFYLSRNEYEKGQNFSHSWQIHQVIFSNDIFDSEIVTSEMVVMTRSLSAEDLSSLVPRDVPTGQWLEVAKITVPGELWCKVDYPDFPWSAPGYKK